MFELNLALKIRYIPVYSVYICCFVIVCGICMYVWFTITCLGCVHASMRIYTHAVIRFSANPIFISLVPFILVLSGPPIYILAIASHFCHHIISIANAINISAIFYQIICFGTTRVFGG